jgi:hypothetical protein
MRKLLLVLAVAAVAALLLVPATAGADPLITEPASPQQRIYPIIITQDVGPGEVGQMFTGCQVNETTGARDTLVTYRIQTTGDVEITAQQVGEGFVFTRQAGSGDGGTVLHVLICERTATGT